MSNERKFPGPGPGRCNPSSLPIASSSGSGATTIRCASSTRCCSSISGGSPTNSGGPAHPPDRTPDHDGSSLQDLVTAVDYDARVNDVAERIAQTTQQAAVLALLRDGAHALGAERAVFVSFVRDDADLSACRFLLACDPAWCQRYIEAGHMAHDPWLAYAAHNSAPIVASTLRIADPEGQRVVALAQGNGFASAVLVPAHSGAGHSRISLLCLGSDQPGYFEAGGFGRMRLSARVLAAELHEWWLSRIRRELLVRARITADDLELLRREYQGLSSKQIAAELDVSPSSINSRFQRMNCKLGVLNRRMAARLALECGLLLSQAPQDPPTPGTGERPHRTPRAPATG